MLDNLFRQMEPWLYHIFEINSLHKITEFTVFPDLGHIELSQTHDVRFWTGRSSTHYVDNILPRVLKYAGCQIAGPETFFLLPL